MSTPDHFRVLINENRRRLQELMKKKAALGLSADPSISLEIEDIEKTIGDLESRLQASELDLGLSLGRPPDATTAVPASDRYFEFDFDAARDDYGIEAIFRNSNSKELIDLIEHLIPHSQHIVLIGTAINLLDVVPIKERLLNRARSGECAIEIYLANPYSRHVNDRLIEEEVGTEPYLGREGIIRRIDTLLKAKEDMPNAQLEIRLFNHYPTAAFLIFDSNLIVYHYDYQELGNHSPAFCYRRSSTGLADHYLRVYERIKRDSVPAKLVRGDRKERRLLHAQDWAQGLPWFAIYLIPDFQSEFYRRWGELIGYDVGEKRILPPHATIERYRGGAQMFGCHITVLDAMAVWGRSQLDFFKEELRWLASQYEPILLRNLGYPRDFRKNALVVEFADDSGQLESLHAELLVRIATQAATSNYQIRGNPAATLNLDNNERVRHMVERYHTPFCLAEFRPHVTVLGDLQDLSVEEARDLVNRAGGKILEKAPLRFREICLMKLSSDGFWEIAERVGLGK